MNPLVPYKPLDHFTWEELLAMRYEPPNTYKWEEERVHFVGASDMPAIVGYGQGKSRYSLWRQVVQGEREQVSTYVEWLRIRGHEDEPELVAQLSAFLRERLPHAPHTMFRAGRYVSLDDPFIAATPDRRLWMHNCFYDVECKSRQDERRARIPTMAQWLQMQQQLACTGAPSCWYICNNVRLDPPEPPVVCEIAPRPLFWKQHIYPMLCEFRQMVWDERSPPKTQRKNRPLFEQEYKQSVRCARTGEMLEALED